ncbi:MAG: hypothetical protein DWQ47_15005 [Acidobacteria bacterium]|nr:MAG: hypothetical protein DWQ32_02405 [Acidobacteriota bacterium]REK02626.1 MAG: hypothetical protein DWQ38_09730 [Acidobacteriota bacterium]REK13570.1 MAG: hypothetical protein DWQ43_08095 [Acidobacteriota bacterium]REK41564.1 MAG: hypothetical protein DWQ47_15005 [Acidobacteriota bacterium]
MKEENQSELAESSEEDESVIDGEVLTEEHGNAEVADRSESDRPLLPASKTPKDGNQRNWLLYILLPFIFLTVALLGGLRIAAETGEFIFSRPALICLVFATILVVLFFRTGLISIGGWFSESLSTLKNASNAAVMVAIFAGSVQVFNSLIPEQGLAFWVVSFCFLWTLGVSYFSVADASRLVRSTVALFVAAFLTKYFLLANLTSTSSGNWLQRLWDDPTREALTYLLDLPRYASATGYVQFFAVALFLLGLFLIPRSTQE